jgi:hypothetical protein
MVWRAECEKRHRDLEREAMVSVLLREWLTRKQELRM